MTVALGTPHLLALCVHTIPNWEEKGRNWFARLGFFPHKNSSCNAVSCHSSSSSSVIISLWNLLPSSEHGGGKEGDVCLFCPIMNAPAALLCCLKSRWLQSCRLRLSSIIPATKSTTSYRKNSPELCPHTRAMELWHSHSCPWGLKYQIWKPSEAH